MIRSVNQINPADQRMDAIVTNPLHDRERNRIVSSTPQSIGHMLKEFCGITADAYALAVINDDGLVTTYLSDGLKTHHEVLFPPAFYDELRRSQNGTVQPYPQGYHLWKDIEDVDMEIGSQGQIAMQDETCTHKNNDGSPGKSPTLPTTPVQLEAADAAQKIALGDWDWVEAYYTQCFLNMHQAACKIIGKAWVKLLEPRKQSKYPYSRRGRAPPWWPLATVRHREPDHLFKAERVALLIHIINIVVRQNPDKSEYLKTITAEKLKNAAQRAASSWFGNKEKPSNAEKRGFLREIVRVTAMEEHHRKGRLDALDHFSVSEVDKVVPDSDDSDDSDTLVSSATPHSTANIIAHTPSIDMPLPNSNPLFYPSCQHHHCATTAKYAQDDCPIISFDYPQLLSYDAALSQQHSDNLRPEWQDRSIEWQYNLFNFTQQQKKATNVSHPPFHPTLPEQTEYNEVPLDSFGETRG